MPNLKLSKAKLCLIIFIACTGILCAVNPAPILLVYKTVYVKYVRITKSAFTSRFKPQDLDLAIEHAKTQPWVQKQIASDLAPFKQQGITAEQIDKWFRTFQHPTETKLAKFTVKNHQLSVDAPNELKDTRAYKTTFSVIKLLVDQGKVPDCEFIISLNDYLGFIPNRNEPAAIFSFAKHVGIAIEKDTILIPDWMNVRYWDTLRGRISLANKLYPWGRKEEKIHWRGGTTDSMLHRAKLVNLNKKLSFLDVGMTEGSNAMPYVDPENSIKFKYQISLDGSRCTWERMIWQMAANAVLIKPNSPQVQWFHLGLEPYINYVPIRAVDEINVSAIYTWLTEHDQEAREISKNANKFAKDNFKTQDFFAYYALVLQEYAKLYKG